MVDQDKKSFLNSYVRSYLKEEILIEKFKNHSAKIELAFEIRRFLHEKEKNKIEKEILENKKKAKSIY
jgi:hypothetical protein